MVVGLGMVFDVTSLAQFSKQNSDIPLITAAPATQVSTVTQRLTAVNATHVGPFHVESDCLFAQVPQAGQKIVQVLVNSELPLASFVVTDSGKCCLGDRSMAEIFRGTGAPLHKYMPPRTPLKAEVRGDSYTLGDFIINIGLASVGQQCRGCIAEIRFTPGVPTMPMDCWKLFSEFVTVALGFRITPEFFQVQLLQQQLAAAMMSCGIPPQASSAQITPQSMALCSAMFLMAQYASQFTALRKPQEQPVASSAPPSSTANALSGSHSDK